jgi:hypothetical protein
MMSVMQLVLVDCVDRCTKFIEQQGDYIGKRRHVLLSWDYFVKIFNKISLNALLFLDNEKCLQQ